MNTKPWIIRSAHPRDARSLSRLVRSNIKEAHAQYYSQKEILIWQRGYGLEEFKQFINTREVFILEAGRTIYGTIQFARPNQIKGLYINPNFRGLGLGSFLLSFLFAHLKLNGIKRVELSSNKWSAGFYKKHYFKVIKRETTLWENHSFIEWKMGRKLINTCEVNNSFTSS